MGLRASTIYGYDASTMMTAPQFADAVGRKNMADALEVGATAVSNAVIRGWFPSSWFYTCQHLAGSVGVECPPQLFGMRPVDNIQNADCGQQVKAAVEGMETNTGGAE